MMRNRILRRSFVLVAFLAIVARAVRTVAAQNTDDELIEMVVNLLGDKDKEMRAVGLEQVRTAAKGETATRRFTERLPKLAPDAQAGLLSALADRGDKGARQAVLDVLGKSNDESVKVAAIEALGVLGEPADLDRIVPLLGSESKAQRQAAQKSLARFSGKGVSTAIAERMKQSPADTRVLLIEVLTTRRATEALPELLAAAVDTDSTVRRAAMKALAELAGREQIPGMLAGILTAPGGYERDAAERAVVAVCNRVSQSEDKAEPFVAAIDQVSERDRGALLPGLGRVGGPSARARIEVAIADPKLREQGLRGLCNWPDASIAPRLIELFEAEKDAKQRAVLLAALIRVAPLPDGRSDADRLALLQTTMKLCADAAEQKQILRRARAIRSIESLRFVLPYLDNAAHAQDACETVVELAHHRGLREPNKSEFDQALDKVIATSKNKVVIERANRYKRGQTWDRSASPQ